MATMRAPKLLTAVKPSSKGGSAILAAPRQPACTARRCHLTLGVPPSPPATRKLSQVTTVRLLAPSSELPPGAVAGVVGGAVGGALAGERAGRGAAIAAFQLTPAPEGEYTITQGIPSATAATAAELVGAARGAVAGAALGAGIATELYGVPSPEYAPAVETAALLGAATGAAVGREAARGTVQAILGGAPAQE